MLALMVDLEEDPDWSFGDDVDDIETDRYARILALFRRYLKDQ